jgi:glycerate-2-kinase
MPAGRTGIRTDRPPAAQTVARIQNRARLTDHGDQELRAAVLDLAEAALAALSPSAGLRRSVRLDGENLVAGGRRYDLAAVDRLVVLGAGKASAEVATALDDLLGSRLDGGVVVVPRAAQKLMQHLKVVPGEHPLPGPASVTGARTLLEQAEHLGERDLAICVFTGGSSALASLPPPPISEAEKA